MSAKTRNAIRNSIRKALSQRLFDSLDLLRISYNDTQVRELLNSDPSIHLTESAFSKLKNACNNSSYLKDLHEKKYSKIFRILDPLIEKECGIVWDNTDKIFKKIDESTRNPRLQGLLGTWEGFSWDATASEAQGGQYVHHFKIKISSINDIRCSIQRATFVGNRITLISTDRVAMEMNSPNRKLFFIIHIGNGEVDDLKNEKTFNLAYLDSGDKKIKSGLAIINRTSKNFDDIMPGSTRITETEYEHYIRFLRDTQIIIK